MPAAGSVSDALCSYTVKLVQLLFRLLLYTPHVNVLLLMCVVSDSLDAAKIEQETASIMIDNSSWHVHHALCRGKVAHGM